MKHINKKLTNTMVSGIKVGLKILHTAAGLLRGSYHDSTSGLVNTYTRNRPTQIEILKEEEALLHTLFLKVDIYFAEP